MEIHHKDTKARRMLFVPWCLCGAAFRLIQ
jgi:hypothetical protein